MACFVHLSSMTSFYLGLADAFSYISSYTCSKPIRISETVIYETCGRTKKLAEGEKRGFSAKHIGKYLNRLFFKESFQIVKATKYKKIFLMELIHNTVW